MSFLFENLYKFNSTKGHKAFSYFNVIAKHWFIQKYKNSKKKTKVDVYFDKTVINKLEMDHQNKDLNYEDKLMDLEFFELLKEEAKKWRGKFEKKQEKIVLESIIIMLENPDLVSIYNKKAIYLYLREITRLKHKTDSNKSS